MEESGGGGRIFVLSLKLAANLAPGDVATRRRPSAHLPSLSVQVCAWFLRRVLMLLPLLCHTDIFSVAVYLVRVCDANGVSISQGFVPSLECPFSSLRSGRGNALARRGCHHTAGGAAAVAVVGDGDSVGGVVVVICYGHPFG